MQTTCQHDYSVQFVYTVLNREAVGTDHFTEYTDKKQGVEWTSLEKHDYILLQSP